LLATPGVGFSSCSLAILMIMQQIELGGEVAQSFGDGEKEAIGSTGRSLDAFER